MLAVLRTLDACLVNFLEPKIGESKMANSEDLMTPGEAARLLGLSPDMVH